MNETKIKAEKRTEARWKKGKDEEEQTCTNERPNEWSEKPTSGVKIASEKKNTTSINVMNISKLFVTFAHTERERLTLLHTNVCITSKPSREILYVYIGNYHRL